MKELNVKALAVSIGIIWALCVLLAGWGAALFDWNRELIEIMSSMYIGYEASFVGGVIGAIWAFIDGVIGGALVALIYNYVAKQDK